MFIEQVCNDQSRALQTSIRAPGTNEMRALQLGDPLAVSGTVLGENKPVPKLGNSTLSTWLEQA